MRAGTWLERATLVAILTLGLAWRWAVPRDVEDLRPRPDALEYEETTRNVLDGEGYCVIVEGGKYPPRYPFGFPALLLPVLALWDRGPGTGIVVVTAAALLNIVAAWRLGYATAGPLVAAAAAGLLAVAPAHVRWSHTVMSDVPSACAVAWLVVAVIAARAAGAGPWVWAGIGAGGGLAATVRSTNLLVMLPAMVAAIAAPGSAGRRAARTAALGAGMLAGLLPLLVYDVVQFGHPLRGGYEFWCPFPLFASKFAFGAPDGGGTEPNLSFYLRTLAGFGTFYTWPIAALVLIGCGYGWWRGGPSRLLVAMTLTLLVPLAALQTVFFWQDTRFLLAALPLLLVVAALPLAGGAPLRILAVGLLLAGVGVLARAPELYRGDTAFHELTLLRDLNWRLPANAALVMRTHEALFRRLLRHPETDRVWVPLAFDEHQRPVHLFHLAPYAPAADNGAWIRRRAQPDDVERTVDDLLAEGRPVYLSMLLQHQVPAMEAILAALQRRFRLEPDSQGLFHVYRQP
jgi:4-amino-4-deoxy-L-arabinose transferase-like glycosyltransferase